MPVSGCVFGNPLAWLVIGRANLRYVWTRISNLIQTSRPSGGLERLYS